MNEIVYSTTTLSDLAQERKNALNEIFGFYGLSEDQLKTTDKCPASKEENI